MLRLNVANRQKLLHPDRRQMRAIFRSVLTAEGRTSADVSLALVDDVTIARINEQFLKHEGPTDVITFPYSEPQASQLEGEIVVSTETAKREARRRGHDTASETYLYFIHGLLHLLGYDDHAPAERRRMRRREKYHLEKMGILLKT